MNTTTRLCIFLLLLVGLAGPVAAERPTDKSLLTIDRIFASDEFDAKGIGPIRWLDDGSGYLTLEDSTERAGGQDIVQYDAATGRRAVVVPAWRLVPGRETSPMAIADYAFSADRKKLLIFTNTQRVWRRHTRGDYWVLDLVNWDLRPIGGEADESMLMFAKFSPDGNRVGYVYRNNIYVQNLQDDTITALTKDGSKTTINGTSDWVYEEELGLRDAFRFSPDGQSIAYWQLDSSGVPIFRMLNTLDSLQPEVTAFRHPKVGQTNSACRFGVVSVEGGKTRWFEPSSDLRNHYIARLQWTADSKKIVFLHFNRLQNALAIMVGDAQTGAMRTVMTEHDEAWVEERDDLTWLDGGKSFLWESERDGWRHLYRGSFSGEKLELLTPGEADVVSVVGMDERRGWVYFIACPNDPTRRYLYRSRLDGTGRPERVSPDEQTGTHEYQIAPGGNWAIHTFSTINTPPVIQLIRLPSHETVRLFEDNSELRSKLAQLKRRPAEMFRVDIGDVVLDGWCIKPPDFDPKRQYPLFYYVYGEPVGSTVNDRWGGQRMLWHTMLAQQGYIVASIDNRGTSAPRGRQWRKCIYRQVGILASADQAAATRKLLQTHSYIDPDRIGIYGASGGGSMSLNAIFRYPKLYSTAMAMSFISDQRLYDTIYQERYMGLPDDNEEGYRKGSPITYAHQLEGNLLVIHGTADDNCHFQSCERLVDKLIEHNKQFSAMFYPNRTHSLSGGNTRRHLYGLLTRYLNDHMPPGPKK